MTPFPAPNRLHVWWARRPLVASRAAVLASLLPADADRDKFLHVLGIHGDPVATRRRIDEARRRGERFEGQAYSYPRAFGHVPGRDDHQWKQNMFQAGDRTTVSVLDPTAGGGSIPFEALRLGCQSFANDLNPVSTLIMRATVEWPSVHGGALRAAFDELAERFVRAREERLAPHFPPEPEPNAISTNYLWARTVTCPYCDGLVAALAELAARAGRHGRSAAARLRQRAGICRSRLRVRDRRVGRGAVSRHGGARRRPLSVR